KKLDELETRFDKWLYILRNLHKLDRVPGKLKERIFEQLFETAEIAKFDHKQLNDYEESLKYYRDLQNSLDKAFEDGIEQNKFRMISALIYQRLLTVEQIAEVAEVSVDKVLNIQSQQEKE
ncbi:MAG: PD-(D/E)XK nuclease family transposase, partial [Bacteroidota bacterium]